MCAVTRSLKHPLATGLICFGVGCAAALAGVWAFGSPWERVRVVEVEKPVEKIVEKVVEKVVEKPFVPPVAKRAGPRRTDLIVMQKGKPLGLDSDFGEFWVEEVRKIPGVDRVSEGVVSSASATDSQDLQFLVQGWKPDNFGFEDMELIAGRFLKEGDSHKVLLGRTLASNLNKKVGDKLAFTADPDTPYEIVGVFKSPVVFEEGGVIVPFEDGQALTGKKVTGFSVRVKKSSPDPAAEVAAVKQKIEALRDPKDPTTRLQAESPE